MGMHARGEQQTQLCVCVCVKTEQKSTTHWPFRNLRSVSSVSSVDMSNLVFAILRSSEFLWMEGLACFHKCPGRVAMNRGQVGI